jgi:hypothetical protein
VAGPGVSWWRAIALATVAVTAIFFLTQQTGSDAAPVARQNASERERLDKIERELQGLGASPAAGNDADRAQLEARIDTMKLEVARLSKALAQRAEEARAEARPEIPDDRPAATAEQRGGVLEEQFAKEAADANWSAAAAQEISRDLRSQGLEDTQLGDVRCRATLCRIEASHSSMEAEQKFIGRIGELEAFRNSEGFVQHVPRSDGSIATMVFVSRAGHRLPSDWDVASRL